MPCSADYPSPDILQANLIHKDEEIDDLNREISSLKKQLRKEKDMPCSSPPTASEIKFYEEEQKKILQRQEIKREVEIEHDRGINKLGSQLDFVTSLLCTHLRYLAEHLKYADFMRLVQPEIKKWFDEHCKNEGGL